MISGRSGTLNFSFMAQAKPTITDIARELTMSPSTVSRALAGHPRISQATMQAVRAAAERLNYSPNGPAAALRRGNTHLIGVLVPRINRAFFASVIHGIETVAAPAGYSIMVMQSREREDLEGEALQALMRARVDGIIASLSAETTDFSAFKTVLDRHTPLVLCDRISSQVNTAKVRIDDYAGAFAATQHLLAQGCCHPVHFSGPEHLNIYADRRAGFVAALEAAGIAFDADRHALEIRHTAEGGAAAAEQLLARAEPFDAVFSASDWAATGAMQRFLAAGLRVPQDVAMVGFASEPHTLYLNPPLSTVRQHSEEIGERAAELLLQAFDGSATTIKDRHVVIEPELIVRQSSLRR